MLASSRWLPLGFVGVGTLLVIATIAFSILFKTNTEPLSVPIPIELSGLSLVSQASGKAALQEFSQLHGKSFPIISGSKASYGFGSQITIWVAGMDTFSDARKLLAAMRDKIAEGNSPFQPTSTVQVGNRTIYALDGMGQKHFYFLSGKNLVWLASIPVLADQALQQALKFYQ